MRGRAVTTKGLLERESSLGVILMLPGALLLMVFMAYPFFLGIWLSITDSMIARMGHFIGLRNFKDLLSSPVRWDDESDRRDRAAGGHPADS